MSTECKDCKFREGNCGNHFISMRNGSTNYDIASLSACDKYGNCMFFERMAENKGDLISREALKKHITGLFEEEEKIDKKWAMGLKYSLKIIDNAPTVKAYTEEEVQEIREEVAKEFMDIIDNALTVCGNNPKWCENCVSKGKCASTRPHGKWIIISEDTEGIHHIKCPFCKYEKGFEFYPYIKVIFDKLPYFCEQCGADMRGGGQ